MSTLLVPAGGAAALEQAFRDRLGMVDDWPGHLGLQVWRDLQRTARYAMSSWHADKAAFARYLCSAEHAASYARIPHGPGAPTLKSLHWYEVLPT